MKTSMQLHIEDLYKIRQMVLDKKCDSDLENTITETIDGCIENAESFLEKEERQITNAYKSGGEEILKDNSYRNEDFFNNAETYFNEKFIKL